jgi:hypothetical protein
MVKVFVRPTKKKGRVTDIVRETRTPVETQNLGLADAYLF